MAGLALGDIHLRFVTHHLCHTQFCHTPSFTHQLCHTPSFTHHLSHTTLSHTIFHHTILHTPLCHTPSFTTPSFTHISVTHHLSHTTLAHTIFHTPSQTIFHTPSQTIFHTSHCYKPSFTYHLSHTTLSHTIFRHTIFHTPLCHTPSFPHNFVTRSLSHTTFTHTIFHTQLCHTHTIFLCHTPSFTYNFVTHNFVLLLDPPPPPLSFLPSPAPLQHYVLIIGRSCLVGLSGPLIRNRRAWMCHLSVPSAPHKWWWKKNWPPKNVSPLAGSYVKQSVLRFCCSFFPGHTTATQLLQPNFHGIGRRGRLLHSHGQSLQQMKQWPQCFHKCHGCATWTKHFACR